MKHPLNPPEHPGGHSRVTFTIVCPRCGANINERCYDLRPFHRSIGRRAHSAHSERLTAAWAKKRRDKLWWYYA